MRVMIASIGLLAATVLTIGAASAGPVASPPPSITLLQRAAGGDARSLRAVAHARRGSDGARAEAIDQAISAALATNPATVLGLIAAGGGLPGAGWYCQDRAIEPAAVAQARFVRTTRSAVRGVHDPRLMAVRARCLASLRGAGGERYSD